MKSSDVTFRNQVVDENAAPDQRKEMEIIEIRYPDGTVGAFPVTDIDSESGQRYCDLYGAKYTAFKNGDPDADHVARLEREIADRKAELDGLRKTKPKDDERAAQRPDAPADAPKPARGVHTRDAPKRRSA